VTWENALRLLVIIGMGFGAWNAWKALPEAVVVNGRKYYPQPDGSYRTIWGRRAKDPAVLEALARADKNKDKATVLERARSK